MNATELTGLMNVGPAVARYLGRAGITRVDQLAGRDPVELYDTICTIDGQSHDPCLLDTMMSATDQANGNPARPWWTYTPTRKALTASSTHRTTA
ncbi:helix-hairpin-helix domain-containing protein [Kribbella sp. NPDC055071]